MSISNIVNKIRCAVNCLRGRPTLYGFTFNKGYIESKSEIGTYIVDNKFLHGSTIKFSE